jgi:hypothetical protein
MDLVAGAQKQAHAPAATEWQSIGHDKADTIVPRGIDQTGGDILRVDSSFQAPNRESLMKRQNPGSCSNLSTGPFGLSNEALVRLEAALRAQRESPADNEGFVQTPDALNSRPSPQRAPECLQSTELPPAVANDIDEYLSQLASFSEREGTDKRLPLAAPRDWTSACGRKSHPHG